MTEHQVKPLKTVVLFISFFQETNMSQKYIKLYVAFAV